MPKSYSSYSKQRKAIMQQVNRLEKRGYVVKERYHLPTVKELKTMTAKEQASVMRRAKSYTTEKVRQSARMPVYQPTKTGKAKKTTISYEKARKRERAASAKAGAETRARHKKEAEAVEKWRKWHKDAYYAPPSEPTGELDYPEPLEDEPDSEYWEPSYEVDEETGEVLEDTKPEVDEDFERWAQDFIESAPLDDRLNAEAYVDALRQGDVPEDINGYDEWLASIGEEPTAKETFQNKMESLSETSPETADWLWEFFQREQTKYGIDELNNRFAKASEIPDFDRTYSGHDTGANFGNIAKMARIISGGKALSGAQARRLMQAIEKDEYE